jgi:anti-sigma factor ChrR (cupin superfamily)
MKYAGQRHSGNSNVIPAHVGIHEKPARAETQRRQEKIKKGFLPQTVPRTHQKPGSDPGFSYYYGKLVSDPGFSK